MSTLVNSVSGTFSGTGTSNGVVTKGKVMVMLAFAGTATVSLQCRVPNGTWFSVKDYTASAVEMAGEETQENIEYRLSCGSYTDDVDYSLSA